ncbi:hypothetical protein C6502_21520 [Candidatus Poribacteria bacterium]|nr:MAG: hypothetical protein C6502_21520 [Candidatus Poribacteria bacterium]
MKTKIFAISGGYFRRISKIALNLEGEINAWLNANPGIKIIDIKQSSCGGSAEPSQTIISIWYELEG